MNGKRWLMRNCSEFKFKVALLGAEESYKSAFREEVSSGSLSNQNKEIIGVTISGLKFESLAISDNRVANLYISLWDLACSDRFSMFRASYYRGSEAIIIILDENTLDQAEYYYEEVLRHSPSLSLAIVVLHDDAEMEDLQKDLRGLPFHQFEQVHARRAQDVISWIVDKFRNKLLDNRRRDNFAFFFLPRRALIPNDDQIPHYLEYACPIENFDELNPQKRINFTPVARLLEKLDVLVKHESAFVANKFGMFELSLRDSSVLFTPRQCLECKSKCTLREYICIIASTKGFSSQSDLSQAELLVIAKALALQDEALPDHVLKQIGRVTKCVSN
jgi:hypothetical protein